MIKTENGTSALQGADQVTRRDFLKWSGIVVISVGCGGLGSAQGAWSEPPT